MLAVSSRMDTVALSAAVALPRRQTRIRGCGDERLGYGCPGSPADEAGYDVRGHDVNDAAGGHVLSAAGKGSQFSSDVLVRKLVFAPREEDSILTAVEQLEDPHSRQLSSRARRQTVFVISHPLPSATETCLYTSIGDRGVGRGRFGRSSRGLVGAGQAYSLAPGPISWS